MKKATIVFLAALTGIILGQLWHNRESIKAAFSCYQQTPCTFQDAFQDPAPLERGRLIVEAPDTCEVGELVQFDASKSTVDSFKWSILPATDDFLVFEGGTKSVFSSREPGAYIVIVSAATEGVASLYVHELKVVGEGDNVEHFVSRWLRKVKYENIAAKREKVQALAAVYYSLASDDATPAEFKEKAVQPTRDTLADDLELWKPFLIALGEYMNKKDEAGHLQTTRDYQVFWKEIADALSQARVE